MRNGCVQSPQWLQAGLDDQIDDPSRFGVEVIKYCIRHGLFWTNAGAKATR
jgi:hypothetical protein